MNSEEIKFLTKKTKPNETGMSIKNRLANALQIVRRRKLIWQQPNSNIVRKLRRYRNTRRAYEEIHEVEKKINMNYRATARSLELSNRNRGYARMQNNEIRANLLRRINRARQTARGPNPEPITDPMVHRFLKLYEERQALIPRVERALIDYLNATLSIILLYVHPNLIHDLEQEEVFSLGEEYVKMLELQAENKIRRIVIERVSKPWGYGGRLRKKLFSNLPPIVRNTRRSPSSGRRKSKSASPKRPRTV
jgi:hypothetical protein